jgi:MPBQ/MSBQ methyltransferase
VRFIQHKGEARWFYRFVSPLYDRWVNPLFWTPEMRTASLRLARLDDRGLETLDVGAGTGFSTEGVIEHVDPERVTLLDQSPDQLGRARAKPALARCSMRLGDAEQLPFDPDSFDRYVSCGSIEYWPDPARALAEAFRVVRPGGVALVVGPLPPSHRVARLLADIWMLFPSEAQYRGWFEAAGFEAIEVAHLAAPWARPGDPPFGIAVAGLKPAEGARVAVAERVERDAGRPRVLRFLAGSLAGAAFVPIGVVLNLRARRRRRR